MHNSIFSGRDYVLKFPDTWEMNNSGILGTDLIGLTPLEVPGDTFRENINIILENLPKSMSDKEYLDLSIKNMRNAFGLKEDAKFSKMKVGSAEGHHLHYTMKMGANEMDNDVYIVINKGAA